MKRTLLVALVSLATNSPSFAQNIGKAQAERPDHTFLRFNEDWSVMSDRSRVGDEAYWDGIKFVPREPEAARADGRTSSCSTDSDARAWPQRRFGERPRGNEERC